MPDGPAAQPRRDTRRLRNNRSCLREIGPRAGIAASQLAVDRVALVASSEGLGSLAECGHSRAPSCHPRQLVVPTEIHPTCQTEQAIRPAFDGIDGCPVAAKLCSSCILGRSVTGEQQLDPLASRKPGKPLRQLTLRDESSARWAVQQHPG